MEAGNHLGLADREPLIDQAVSSYLEYEAARFEFAARLTSTTRDEVYQIEQNFYAALDGLTREEVGEAWERIRETINERRAQEEN